MLCRTLLLGKKTKLRDERGRDLVLGRTNYAIIERAAGFVLLLNKLFALET
jgi:hypothetical protein